MKTDVKKTPKRTQKRERSRSNRKFHKDELAEAVKKAFNWTKGRIDARFLWSDCGVHRFRVNCWDDVAIQQSEFVYVVEEDNKLAVKRDNQ